MYCRSVRVGARACLLRHEFALAPGLIRPAGFGSPAGCGRALFVGVQLLLYGCHLPRVYCGIGRAGPGRALSWATSMNSPAGFGSPPAPAGRTRVRAGDRMRSRACHMRSFHSPLVHVVLRMSVGACTVSTWRRPNVLWVLVLHTVYRGDASARR